MIGHLIKRGEKIQAENTGKMPCDDGSRAWNDASICQGVQRIAGNARG